MQLFKVRQNVNKRDCSKAILHVNPLPDMPILGSSSSAANIDMKAKIWTNIYLQLSAWVENIVGGEIARFSFSHIVFKSSLLLMC